ncbi:MAG TPA: RDD family protein, partial [Lentisphaeria bacterium]|nr:RDD family protein [Lentisphaeria bacterium]
MNGAPKLRIRTQDGVTFAYQIAGPFSRFLAWLTDLCLVLAVTAIVSQLTAVISVFPSLAGATMMLAGFAIWTGYGILFETLLHGQTLGKRFLQLRVVDQTGHVLSFPQVVVRNLLRGVDMLPVAGLLGGVCVLLNRHGQRLGDLAAGTVVIVNNRFSQPDFSQLGVPKYNSLRDYPHLAARLRQLTSPEMAATLL